MHWHLAILIQINILQSLIARNGNLIEVDPFAVYVSELIIKIFCIRIDPRWNQLSFWDDVLDSLRVWRFLPSQTFSIKGIHDSNKIRGFEACKYTCINY